jgi:hypothetical protein
MTKREARAPTISVSIGVRQFFVDLDTETVYFEVTAERGSVKTKFLRRVSSARIARECIEKAKAIAAEGSAP